MDMPTIPRKKVSPITGIAILLILLGSVIGYTIYQTVSSGGAGLLVSSNVKSTVLINGEQKGKTPLELSLNEGEVLIKLVPDESTLPFLPYETKVRLSEDVKTIVRHEFGDSEGGSADEIISFEKETSTEAKMAIVTNPDKVSVKIDNKFFGITPLKLTTSEGKHTILLSKEGYMERTLEVVPARGYTLTVFSKLSKISKEKSDVKGATTEEKHIKILDTPTGFLRVRKDPTLTSLEIGKATPGFIYPMVEEKTDIGWYKIKLEKSLEGWVSGEFATRSGEPSQVEGE